LQVKNKIILLRRFLQGTVSLSGDHKILEIMYWTLELASNLEDAPWPATKDELIDYAQRSGAPLEVIENLQEMEDEGEIYECMEDIWPDYPSKEDFFFNEEEY
jgi:hypothetical protein